MKRRLNLSFNYFYIYTNVEEGSLGAVEIEEEDPSGRGMGKSHKLKECEEQSSLPRDRGDLATLIREGGCAPGNL